MVRQGAFKSILIGPRSTLASTAQSEAIQTIRAGQLRKLLRERFGLREAEQAMNDAWRSAPASPGAPVPNSDQSHFSPSVMKFPHSMLVWRREFHEEVNGEQQFLESIGGWCG